MGTRAREGRPFPVPVADIIVVHIYLLPGDKVLLMSLVVCVIVKVREMGNRAKFIIAIFAVLGRNCNNVAFAAAASTRL